MTPWTSQSANQLPDDPITQLPDSRAPSAIGRTARLELHFERRGGRTVLAHAYAEPPFRIGRAFAVGDAAYVIIVCSGPGIFAGDALRQSVRVGRGARVVLTSQSALQVHPSAARSPATIRHDYDVGEGAELHGHWDPVIPFAAARLDQRFDLRVTPDSRLYWTDALMAGRVSRGEAWRFESLAHELSLRVGTSLAYLERYRLGPADRAVPRPWIAADATHLATALVRHPNATREAADALQGRMVEHAGVSAGVDLVAPGLIVSRFMCANGAPFARVRASYRSLALASIFGSRELATRK